MPQISIVIPTYNRVVRLRQVVEAVICQNYPEGAFEVVIVSDGSTDGTDEFLKSLGSPFRCFFQGNQGPAAARNLAIRQAQGELIVFIDDDVVPLPQLLAEHMLAHTNAGRDVAVIGPLLTPVGFDMSPWVRWEQDMLMKQYRAMLRKDWEPTARQFYTGNASVKKKYLMEAGGFNENFRRAEDVELAYRLAGRGLDFVFSMAAAGLHFAERSFLSWLDMACTYGRNDAIFARDYKQLWLHTSIRREFEERQFVLRQLVRLCFNRPKTTVITRRALEVLARAGSLARAKHIEKSAYSGLFALHYYQAFSNEVGDNKFFQRRR